MGILSRVQQGEVLGAFHDELFTTREVYVRDFFPPDDDDDGMPRVPPPTEPPMPEMKSFGHDDPTETGEVDPVLEEFGAFALAAMGSSDRDTALA